MQTSSPPLSKKAVFILWSKMTHNVLKRMKNRFLRFFGVFVHNFPVFLTDQKWRKKIVSKDAQCSESYFCIHELFLVRYLVFEIWSILYFIFEMHSDLEKKSKKSYYFFWCTDPACFRIEDRDFWIALFCVKI